MGAPKVYNGTSWVPCSFKQYRGSVWEERPAIYDGSDWVGLYDKVPEVVTLSGGTNTANAFNAQARAEIQWQVNGNVYYEDNSGPDIQVNTATDWVRPTTYANQYQIRYTHSGAPITQFGATAGNGVWWPLSNGTFFIWVVTTGTGFDTKSETVTIEIRKGTGPVLASALYTVIADREDF